VLPRFFAPDAAATSAVVALPGDEAAHLARVLRLRSGDAVRVFDGRGGEWEASVEEVGRGRASVRLATPIEPMREAGVSITVAAAVLKADHMDAVVRDAVMLGAVAVLPMLTDRTEVSARAIERGGRIERWRRIAIASAKQCGRAVVPAVYDAVTLAIALTSQAAVPRIMLIEPSASDARALSLGQLPRASAVQLFVGPEGGWTMEEQHLAASSGCMLVTLGAQTIRAVSAPLVAMSALRAVWEDL
jgi:16S rRNA (uracil1498-N3)-methyltransferase